MQTFARRRLYFDILKYDEMYSSFLLAEEQGCISEFENTAAFSREYQLSQRCMCDGEHMFSCPPDPPTELDMRFPDHHKNLVAKKYKNDVSIAFFNIFCCKILLMY